MAKLHLILGGARSGKSRRAEAIASALAEQKQAPVVYIATAEAGDGEMSARIAMHQQQRPDHWQLVESPIKLAETLSQYVETNTVLLVDCLTLWLTNCLCNLGESGYLTEKKQLLDVLMCFNANQLHDQNKHGNIVLVSNEVGHGIVPLGALSRQFVDYSGWLHQEIAEIAQQVDFVIAGQALILKGSAVKK